MRSYKAVLLFATLVGACVDAVAPCSDGCAPDLVFNEFKVNAPTPGTGSMPAIYSGDTLTITLEIVNRGSAASDSAELHISTGWQYDSTIVRIVPPIQPGGRFAWDTTLVLRRMLPPHVTAYWISAALIDPEHPGIAFIHAGAPPMQMRPTGLMVLNAAPRYPAQNITEIVIDNPAPRPLAGGTLVACITEDFDCDSFGATTVQVGTIAAGERRVLQVPLPLARSENHDDSFMNRKRIRVWVCFGDPEAVGHCSNNLVDIQPDFERFCAVLRVQPGVLLTSTTVGRCGSTATDKLDILSFEAQAAATYDVQLTGATRVRLVSPEGDPEGTLTQSGRIQLGRTGRYYLLVDAAAGYSIRIDNAP